MLSAAARVRDQLEASSFHRTASQREKANVKKGGDGRVEDKERDGDGLLMDSTVPHCQFPFLIEGLFLKRQTVAKQTSYYTPSPLTVTRLYFPDCSEPEALELCFLLLSNINDNGPFLWDYFNQNQRYK